MVPYSDYVWTDDFYDVNDEPLDLDGDNVPDPGTNPAQHGDNNTWARTTPIFFHARDEAARPAPTCAHVTFDGSGSASPVADGGDDAGMPGDAAVLPVAIPGGYNLEWNRWRFTLAADYQYIDLSFFTAKDEDDTGHVFAVRIDGQLVYSGRAGIDHDADTVVEKAGIPFALKKGLHQLEVHMDDQEYATGDNDPNFHCNDYDGPAAFLDTITFHANAGAACDDQTPPQITCPAGLMVECSAAGGAPVSDAAIASFLAGATATDAIDPTPTITHDAPPFFPNGTTVVTFTAGDDNGNTASCSAAVTVRDTTPPVISAQWVPQKPWRTSRFFVAFSATDTCDLAPSATAVLRTPSVAGWRVKKERSRSGVEVEFDLHKHRVEIEAPNPDAILTQLQTDGGLLIDNGASVDVDWERNHHEYEIEVDARGRFEVEGRSVTLEVTAVDAAGNRATARTTRTR